MNEVIIFTRYPEAGKTKTRMIPLLGEMGAATLQRQMTEYTLATVKKLVRVRGFSAQVYFTGADLAKMSAWLGAEVSYRAQESGDLGERLQQAFREAFEEGVTKVVIIGVDCPNITDNLLKEAFFVLDSQDLVLGPAQDGGYYLIGLKRLFGELFRGISWGTGDVLAQTLVIAQNLGLNTGLLPILADVDRPEDYFIWQERQKY
jgi:rSAM/selenodomain-associated transferase 1